MMAGPPNLLRLYFVTWNVATKYPEQELHQLLGINHSVEHKPPDFYIIGLQEVKSQPQNMLLDFFSDDPWSKSFRDILKYHDYVKIKTQRLQGIVLNVFCLRKHMNRLRSIEARYTKTGFGGLWGNKGAVSVRLNLYGVSLCLVNTHLTPHDHLLAERVSDYNTILREHVYEAPDTSSIFYHDYIFWIGDLNFRLGEGLSPSDINLLVRQSQLDVLLAKDQLKRVMTSGEAFAELTENEISFPPTYKYEFGSQDFDLKRRPSWTDRILFKVNADVYENVKLKAEQHTYKSHSSYVQSDHKPVTGEFDIVIRPDVDGPGIEFEPISEWFIDEANAVSYKLVDNTKPESGDWIGLYKEGFSSIDEYLVYEYVNRGLEKSGLPEEISANTKLIETLYFGDTAIRTTGMYRLVYVTQRGDILGILGVSQVFPGHHR
ncbi:inositol polyphosphate 5-phosphatase K-like isoform X1 [Belonocnema kinseyi]|uniref:inositol polyphosphate 5-phosphatase K-like isoform X1 n=1 Tax=Belonocnema kinseyi TaxID=2817044 RepID=UPI00143DE58C|nr:inositol polyphosphate 5-phosphatase K-like isoform X1 [Belonocnema kinseyi]